jgi:hypothetical protein
MTRRSVGGAEDRQGFAAAFREPVWKHPQALILRSHSKAAP